MVKRKGSYETLHNENMRGGEGIVSIENLLTQSELYEKGRLFAKITVNPGCSIGKHVHQGEMECFYIVSGAAEFSDNGEAVELNAGDTALTISGQEHSVRNTGSVPLEMIALIVFEG